VAERDGGGDAERSADGSEGGHLDEHGAREPNPGFGQ